MIGHKTTRYFALAAFTILSTSAIGQSSNPPPGRLPEIQPVDQRYLTQFVRRTIDAELAGGPSYKLDYVPPTLAAAKGQVVVTLREYGKVRAIGVSQSGPIVDATREAALLALESLDLPKGSPAGLPSETRIEMQVLGPPVAYAGDADWTSPGALTEFIDPGIEGVNIFFDGQQRWFTPGGMIARNVTFDQALEMLAKEVSLDPAKVHEGKLSKFATLHWWEYDDMGRTVTLRRGMTVVGDDAVTATGLDEAIRKLGKYMIYRQRPGGRFAYEYLPGSDMYPDRDSELAQAGAAWAMAEYASRFGGDAARDCAERSIAERLTHLADLRNVENASYFIVADGRNKLGITAQLCLSLTASPEASRYAEVRRRLVNAILWLQLPTGRFVTVFPPGQIVDPQDVFPGQALLALARCYALEPSSRIVDAFAKAYPFYRDYFAKAHSPAMMPWHMQAFGQMAIHTKRRDYADFVFAMADAVCKRQLTKENSTSPQLWGAIAGPGMVVGDATTAFVASLADAAILARSTGDDKRAATYESACRRGARFVMQLQVRPEECYYMRSPKEAIGGIRDKPTTTRLRIDSCQHALLGLMKVRQLLFDDRP